MSNVILSQSQARKIILHAAGLSKRAQFGKGKEGAYKAIDHLGFIQVDTNYVVERAHHHSLAARVPDYKTQWLDELQSDGRIFEFWTFASGFIPMDEFRFSLPVKKAFMARRTPATQVEVNLMKKILDRISREGPLMARDFENDRVTKSSGWWDWRPSKVALEWLHLEGKLITTRRGNFQKVYDLPENILPGDLDMTMPTDEEFAQHVIRRSLKALGIGYLKDVVLRGRYVKIPFAAELKKMIAAGEVVNVEIEGLKTSPLFMLAEYKKKKISLSGDAFILSPFDLLNVHRQRLKDLFGFDYMVECFVPEKKRKYGYFSLPVLVGDTFVARMDSKADRKQRALIVNNLHFESVKLSKEMTASVADAIQRFAKFNQCDKVIIKKTNNKSATSSIVKLMV
jgi:uncharacterized protein YcaQ